MAGLTHVMLIGMFLPDLVFSLADKTVSGFMALAVIEARSPGRANLGHAQPPEGHQRGAAEYINSGEARAFGP